MKAIGCRQDPEFQAHMRKQGEKAQRRLEEMDRRTLERIERKPEPVLNASKAKRGGIWFFKLGRLNFQFSVSKR